MSSKNRKMQRKLEREEAQNRMIAEWRQMSLGFEYWKTKNVPFQSVQIGKTEISTEVMKRLRESGQRTFEQNKERFKMIGIVTSSLKIPEETLKRLHENTSYAESRS